MTTQIQDDMLHSGDLVGFEYLIKPGANETLLGLAIKRVKDDLWADRRFDYQGSYEETRTNKSGLDGAIIEERYLIINVIVRKYPRGERPTEQQASMALATAIALMAGALIAYLAVLEHRTTTVVRIATDPNMSEQTKRAALEALGKPAGGIGGTIAAAGGSLVAAAIVIGVLWALSLSKSRGLSD
ncbi:MAG: hypothetical protein MUC88_20480 [Planctomycetes bacterium]|jgi:hypothetical protein|nr:hypothetical protein [Planctomycetota bacterium]